MNYIYMSLKEENFEIVFNLGNTASMSNLIYIVSY